MSKPTAKDILKLLEEDESLRVAEFRRHLRHQDYEGVTREDAILDYIRWLISHIDYWIANGDEP